MLPPAPLPQRSAVQLLPLPLWLFRVDDAVRLAYHRPPRRPLSQRGRGAARRHPRRCPPVALWNGYLHQQIVA